AEDRVVSRSAQLRLTTQDYRAYIGLLDRKDAEELTSQKDRMLDFVLSFHSNRVLADQALQQGLENDSKVKQHLENARRAVLVTALMDKEMRSLQYPDFEKISRERYEAEKSSYGLPEKRKVAHILIKLKSPSCACDDRDPQKEASEIVKRLEAGADFAELASQYSTDKSTSKNGGLIDLWLEKDTDGVSPEFLQTAFALAKPGDFRQPLETRSGIHIIKLVEVEPWRQLSYDEIKQRLIQKLRFEYRDSARVLLRSKAYPDPDTIDFQALESVLKEKR
ncbi:MAG: peptidylprolyl isomerase, partial [Methylococcales bacterium]